MAGLWEAYTASTTGQKLVISIILMEEGEQRQVVRPGQDYTDSNTIAQEISRHQGLNWQQFTFTTLVLDGGIMQFKLEESVGPVNVYTDDITSTLWLLGNNTLIVEGVMQDVLAYLGPKWDLGYAEISKEGVQFEAYISSYTITITPMEEGYIKQWQLMGMEKIPRQQELDLQCVVTRSVKTFNERISQGQDRVTVPSEKVVKVKAYSMADPGWKPPDKNTFRMSTLATGPTLRQGQEGGATKHEEQELSKSNQEGGGTWSTEEEQD